MSKDVAVVDESGIVIAINVQDDAYDLQPNEILVTNPAWVGGDYVDGYFYAPQPFPSWTRHEGDWIPPKPRPQSIGNWLWNEQEQEWQD